METIVLELRTNSHRTFIKWFSVVVILYSLVCIILMLTSIMPINIFLIITMFLLLMQVAVNWSNMKPLKMVFSDKGITGSISPRKTIDLIWDQIAQIEVHILSMDIRTKDGSVEHIDLGEITYEQQKIIKPKIIEMAKSKGVVVQAA